MIMSVVVEETDAMHETDCRVTTEGRKEREERAFHDFHDETMVATGN